MCLRLCGLPVTRRFTSIPEGLLPLAVWLRAMGPAPFKFEVLTSSARGKGAFIGLGLSTEGNICITGSVHSTWHFRLGQATSAACRSPEAL